MVKRSDWLHAQRRGWRRGDGEAPPAALGLASAAAAPPAVQALVSATFCPFTPPSLPLHPFSWWTKRRRTLAMI